MNGLLMILAIIVGLILLAYIAFELLYQKRDQKTIEPLTNLKSGWQIKEQNSSHILYSSNIKFRNKNEKFEGTMANMRVEQKILFKNEYLNDIHLESKIIPDNYGVRKDGYIPAFLVPAQTEVNVEVQAKFTGNLDNLDKIHAVVLRIYYTVYDRRGYYRDRLTDIIFVPVQEATQSFSALSEKGALIYPVKTHLLSASDDLGVVINKYAGSFLKEGDIVVIAESPIAITEGRFKHPSQIKLSWWAKRLCYFVPSVGSLSSPYGMQCAIDQIGVPKFVGAMFAGFVMKLLGKNGWFYTLAGMESELIDDLTGTIAPYDQYIVLGPENPDNFVTELKKKIGVDVAIADANDLKKARILACTLKDGEAQIRNWMLNNPAGNSNEQTPIVIIRPDNLDTKKRNAYDQTCEV